MTSCGIPRFASHGPCSAPLPPATCRATRRLLPFSLYPGAGGGSSAASRPWSGGEALTACPCGGPRCAHWALERSPNGPWSDGGSCVGAPTYGGVGGCDRDFSLWGISRFKCVRNFPHNFQGRCAK